MVIGNEKLLNPKNNGSGGLGADIGPLKKILILGTVKDLRFSIHK
jgi:hypothetical protein